MLAFSEQNGSFAAVNRYRVGIQKEKHRSFDLTSAELVRPESNGVVERNCTRTRAHKRAKSTCAAVGDQSVHARTLGTWLWSMVTLPCALITKRVQEAFLPVGYPDSVSSDYLAYQFWDTLQDLTTHLNQALAKASFFKAVLYTNTNGNPDSEVNQGSHFEDISMGIAVFMLLRQLCQKLGPLCFGWIKFAAIDSNAKKYRFLMDVLNDLVIFLEISLPLLPTAAIIPAACLGSGLSGIVCVVASATKTSLVLHHARANNAADVAAKEQYQLFGAQVICLGLACGIFPFLTENHTSTFLIFFGCSALHIYCNVRAQRVLQLTSLNEARLLICLDQFLNGESHGHDKASIPTVSEVNRKESIFFGFGIRDVDVCGLPVRLGASLAAALHADLNQNLDKQLMDYVDKFEAAAKPFIIFGPSSSSGEAIGSVNINVAVALRKDICHRPREMLEACVRAILVGFHINSAGVNGHRHIHIHPMDPQITAQFEEFEACLTRRGFDTGKVHLGSEAWRYEKEIGKCE